MSVLTWMAGLLFPPLVVVSTIYCAGWVVMVLVKAPLAEHTNWIWFDYWILAPQLRRGPIALSVLLSLLACCSPAFVLLVKPKRALHGKARIATEREIRSAHLHADKGIIVGKRGRKYLVFGGQQHVLMSAPTRSGKGVGIVIPNLLNWPDSVVVLDIKQENWKRTSGFRHKHQQDCYLFNPVATDLRTARYNPLSYISTDPRFRIDDIQKIANIFYPLRENVDPIWNGGCRSLFLGLVLLLIETPPSPVTLGEVLRTALDSDNLAAQLDETITDREESGYPLSSACRIALNDFIGAGSKTGASIKKTFTARLELWMNPVVDAATSGNDFDLRELRRRKVSLYVAVAPGDLHRLQPLISLLFQQVIDLNTRALPEDDPTLKFQCLLLMDEFAAIGKIEALTKGIGFIAGYNLRMLPIIQSPAQIREIYGHDAAQTFLVNHALHVIFAPRDFSVAREVSESLGTDTVTSTTHTTKKGFFGKRDPTVSRSDHARALLLPQEVRDLGPDRALLLLEGSPPILVKKVRYFQEPVFINRVLKPHVMAPLALKCQAISPAEHQDVPRDPRGRNDPNPAEAA